MLVARSVALFVLAALAEIGGAWLVWQGVREHRGAAWVGAGVVAGGASAISAAAAPTQATGLAVGDHLAPSNLLENGR